MSRCLQISYDLIAPGRDYVKLHTYLKSFSGWSHALESMWFVRTSKDLSQVRDELQSHVDANDKVIVIDVTGDGWATSNVPGSTTAWMISTPARSSKRLRDLLSPKPSHSSGDAHSARRRACVRPAPASAAQTEDVHGLREQETVTF